MSADLIQHCQRGRVPSFTIAASRLATHDSGSGRFVTPLLCHSFFHNSTPDYPGALRSCWSPMLRWSHPGNLPLPREPARPCHTGGTRLPTPRCYHPWPLLARGRNRPCRRGHRTTNGRPLARVGLCGGWVTWHLVAVCCRGPGWRGSRSRHCCGSRRRESRSRG